MLELKHKLRLYLFTSINASKLTFACWNRFVPFPSSNTIKISVSRKIVAFSTFEKSQITGHTCSIETIVTIHLCSLTKTTHWKNSSSGGSKGGAKDARPPWGPNSFNFMQFLGKFGKIVCWRPPGSWRPLLGEILDPPLSSVCHIRNSTPCYMENVFINSVE